ncbi:ABC transporter permease [Jatrophihabitans lederbergiae]|uniref:ABC transporter permease n=1 Tax=Jatrophihabitans lederbergiae TaxID=3075547 RepID=A0ABU2JEZ0_9ACTN|nr:ABC transporter permease [Jatrophihabitans sp. DSM 44399]MDT0263564.1 ABC transporter permease [Jatrophihabitans sp. DSM 44399]
MAIDQQSTARVSGGEPTPGRTAPRTEPNRWINALSFQTISAVYIFIALFVLFSFWVPDTFLRANTWRAMLDDQSITALTAVGLVIPLSAGTFNLAIGAQVGFGSIVSAWFLSHQGLPIAVTLVLTLISGAAIGLITGLLIVAAKIDSFIATLGVSSVLLALTTWVSGGQQILDLGASYQRIATNDLFGITYPVYFVVVVSLAVWYVLERTPSGRRVYATGGNAEAARLAGVRTSVTVVLCLVGCGVIAAAAGCLVSSRLATGDPTVGPGYLLPAFAAAFLGSTQFRGGRYNVWGTVLAVYVLATGVKGLQLAGAPVWIPDLFNGLALLLAVGLAKRQGRSGRGAAIARMIGRRRRTTDPGAVGVGPA